MHPFVIPLTPVAQSRHGHPQMLAQAVTSDALGTHNRPGVVQGAATYLLWEMLYGQGPVSFTTSRLVHWLRGDGSEGPGGRYDVSEHSSRSPLPRLALDVGHTRTLGEEGIVTPAVHPPTALAENQKRLGRRMRERSPPSPRTPPRHAVSARLRCPGPPPTSPRRHGHRDGSVEEDAEDHSQKRDTFREGNTPEDQPHTRTAAVWRGTPETPRNGVTTGSPTPPLAVGSSSADVAIHATVNQPPPHLVGGHPRQTTISEEGRGSQEDEARHAEGCGAAPTLQLKTVTTATHVPEEQLTEELMSREAANIVRPSRGATPSPSTVSCGDAAKGTPSPRRSASPPRGASGPDGDGIPNSLLPRRSASDGPEGEETVVVTLWRAEAGPAAMSLTPPPPEVEDVGVFSNSTESVDDVDEQRREAHHRTVDDTVPLGQWNHPNRPTSSSIPVADRYTFPASDDWLDAVPPTIERVPSIDAESSILGEASRSRPVNTEAVETEVPLSCGHSPLSQPRVSASGWWAADGLVLSPPRVGDYTDAPHEDPWETPRRSARPPPPPLLVGAAPDAHVVAGRNPRWGVSPPPSTSSSTAASVERVEGVIRCEEHSRAPSALWLPRTSPGSGGSPVAVRGGATSLKPNTAPTARKRSREEVDGDGDCGSDNVPSHPSTPQSPAPRVAPAVAVAASPRPSLRGPALAHPPARTSGTYNDDDDDIQARGGVHLWYETEGETSAAPGTHLPRRSAASWGSTSLPAVQTADKDAGSTGADTKAEDGLQLVERKPATAASTAEIPAHYRASQLESRIFLWAADADEVLSNQQQRLRTLYSDNRGGRSLPPVSLPRSSPPRGCRVFDLPVCTPSQTAASQDPAPPCSLLPTATSAPPRARAIAAASAAPVTRSRTARAQPPHVRGAVRSAPLRKTSRALTSATASSMTFDLPVTLSPVPQAPSLPQRVGSHAMTSTVAAVPARPAPQLHSTRPQRPPLSQHPVNSLKAAGTRTRKLRLATSPPVHKLAPPPGNEGLR